MGTVGPAGNTHPHNARGNRLRRALRPPPKTAIMPTIVSLLVVIGSALFLLVVTNSQSIFMARPGDTAPDFELEVYGNENHTRGDVIKLSQFKGQPVIVNFWYPSCSPCRLEMPHLEETFNNHKADGLQVIGVMLLGLDSVEDGQDFIDELGVTYATGPDPDTKITIDYMVSKQPHTVFLDKNHKVARTWTGLLTVDKFDELLQEHGLIPQHGAESRPSGQPSP